MEWIEINKNNLPNMEILAANFNPKNYGYKEKILGYLSIEKKIIICQNEYEILQNCTHYIDINKYDI